MNITGNKNVDTLILDNLDDKDLLNFCLTQKNICDEEFWKRRTYKKYKDVCKPITQTWKQYYLYRLTHTVLSYSINGVKVTIEVDKNGKYSQWYLNTVKEIHTRDENKYLLDTENKELKSDEEIIDLGARELLWDIVNDIEDFENRYEEGIEILSGEGNIINSEYLKGEHHLVEKFPDLVYNGYKEEYQTFDKFLKKD